MKTRTPLLFLMVGLLAMSFALPAMASAKPNWALEQSDVTGWYLDTEADMSADYGLFTIEAWWQVWRNNVTWATSTAALCIMVMDFGIDLNIEAPGYGTLWDMLLEQLGAVGFGFTEVSIAGFDHAATWNESGLWFGMGISGEYFVMAFGYASQGAPMDPFTGLSMVKAPTDTAVNETDVVDLMTAQGGAWPGIPGFEMAIVFLAVGVLISAIFLLRKDQHNLLKNI